MALYAEAAHTRLRETEAAHTGLREKDGLETNRRPVTAEAVDVLATPDCQSRRTKVG
jgi:hypothetical protein